MTEDETETKTKTIIVSVSNHKKLMRRKIDKEFSDLNEVINDLFSLEEKIKELNN